MYCKTRLDLHVDGLESVWIETTLDQTSILVGSFYRPPNSNVNYWNLIEESIEKANDTSLKFLILGDFNTNFLNAPSPHLLDILNRYQLKQLIKEPTRITELTNSCLDLVITQSPNIVKSTEVLPPICSDHSVPRTIIRNTIVKEKSFKRTIFNYNKLDIDKFCHLLKQMNWNGVVYDKTVDESAEIFSNTIMNNAKLCMPTRAITIHPNDVL